MTQTAPSTSPGDPGDLAAAAARIAELFAFLHDRRRARDDEYAGLSDDEASPLNLDEIDAELEKGGRTG